MDYLNESKVRTWLINNSNKTYNCKHSQYNILLNLLKNHPRYHYWKKQDPIQFKITYNNKIVKLFVKFDKRFEIKSWISCTRQNNNKHTTDKKYLTSAMRYSVRRQISIYRKNNNPKICSICNSKQNIQVDHYPIKFCKIRDEFLLKYNPPQLFDYHPKYGYSMFKKVDLKYKQSWQRYHKKHATYRFLCSTCNKKY